ncbi:O-antigen ligase family protein [Patescibacteria group bacterium]|nr:O-antigen ligase family protein [Patescibacteria group bacterium]
MIKKSFKIPKYSVLFLIFTVIATVSLLLVLPNYPLENLAVSSFYIFRLIIYLLGGIVVFNMVDNKLISRDKIFESFIWSGMFLAIAGFFQLVILPDFTTLDPTLGWDPHKNRLASTFFDPNFLGAYFVLCLILLLEKRFPFKKADKTDKKIKGSVIKFTVILLALFFTFSRSAWGMFAVAVLIYGFFRSKNLLFGAFFVVFLAYFAVPRIQTRISGITDPADSASLRLVSWGNTVKIVKDNLWFGVGFNTFRYVQRQYGFLIPEEEEIHSGAGSDSSLLFVLATTGIFGFLIYLLAMTYPAVDSFFGKKEGWLVIFTVIMGFLLESQFINSLFYPQLMFFTYCILFNYP